MKIGTVVDGESEQKALPEIYGDLGASSGNQLLRPVVAKVTPTAPVPVIAQGCTSAVRQLTGRGVDLILVLIDREDRPDCVPGLAAELERRLAPIAVPPITVIVKNRMFENWLVADPEALAAQPQRFAVSRNDLRRIGPNKADHIDATALLKRSCQGSRYHKVQDSGRILANADPLRIAENSRSFRRLMRVLGHPQYAKQSRQP